MVRGVRRHNGSLSAFVDGRGAADVKEPNVTDRPVPTGKADRDYLAAVTVGGPQPVSRIVVVDYDPQWPGQFQALASSIRAALGGAVLGLEHVGSTSVPGLAAKPKIDIDLIVADSSDEDAYVPHLERAGFTLRIREPDWYEHRVLVREDPDVNLHVFSPGAEELKRHLIFRDWLRGNDDDRNLYASVKRRLAEREWEYVADYAEAKNQVVATILTRAGYIRPVGDPS